MTTMADALDRNLFFAYLSAVIYMTSNTTVVHPCAASYLSQTAISAGSAAEQAAVRKTAKYALLPATHVFVPNAFETLGPVNAEVQSFTRSWDVAFRLSPEINMKQISSCSAFPSVCSATMPLHLGVHFRMVVKPGMRPDFLENIFTPNIIFVFLRDIINTSEEKSNNFKKIFFITRPHYFTGSG